MTNYQIINSVDHKDTRVITTATADLGDNLHTCPAYTFEFRDLQVDFPILLQERKEGGFLPVVLMGFEQAENLFLEGASWSAFSKPAYLKKGPFIVGQHQANDAEPVNVLSIDMANPRVSRTEGEPLFQPLGGRTPFLESMADLVERIYHGAGQTEAFADRLSELNLIESLGLDITLRDGSKNQLIGFYTINEDRVRSMSGSELERLSSEGFLMPLFMVLASLGNLYRLIELKERRMER